MADNKEIARESAERISNITTRAIGPDAGDEWFAKATAIVESALDQKDREAATAQDEAENCNSCDLSDPESCCPLCVSRWQVEDLSRINRAATDARARMSAILQCPATWEHIYKEIIAQAEARKKAFDDAIEIAKAKLRILTTLNAEAQEPMAHLVTALQSAKGSKESGGDLAEIYTCEKCDLCEDQLSAKGEK